MSIMGKMVRIPAGNTTNEHYNFVVAKPLVQIKGRVVVKREGEQDLMLNVHVTCLNRKSY